MHTHNLGIKVSGAIRRLGRLRGRTRREWADAKRMDDARYAAETLHLSRRPRLVKSEIRALRELSMDAFWHAADAPAFDVHTSRLPRRSQIGG